VPWCKRCREKTPEGEGVEQPVEKPSIEDYRLDEQAEELLKALAVAAVKAHYHQFDIEFLSSESSTPEKDCFHETFLRLLQAMKDAEGNLTRNKLEELARGAATAFVKDENWARRHTTFRDLSNRPQDD